MNYQLFAYKNNQYHLLDLGAETPALNLQFNDIADLKDIHVDYSQAINLPRTKTNDLFFEFAGNVDAATKAPYRRYKCELHCNGILISNLDSVLLINKVTEKSYNAHIVGNGFALFEAMQSTKMRDVEIMGIYYSQNTMQDVNGTSSGDWIFGTVQSVKPETTLSDNFYDQYPFAHYWRLMRHLFGHFGYWFIDDVPYDEITRNLYLSLASMEIAQEDLVLNNAGTKVTGTLVNVGGSPANWRPPVTGLYDNFNLIPNATEHRFEYYSQTSGTIRIDTNIFIHNPNPQLNDVRRVTSLFEFFNKVSGEVLASSGDVVDFMRGVSDREHNFSLEVEVDAGNTYSFNWNLQLYSWGELPIVGAEFTITQLTGQGGVPNGGVVQYGNNSGFETAFDIAKAYAQLFGLTVIVDEVQKDVYMYSINQWLNNLDNAVDWSDKLDTKGETISFALTNYGQNNFIELKENNDDNTIKQTATFEIDNQNLQKNKTLFELPFESIRRSLGQSFAFSPIAEYDDLNVLSSRKTINAKPRLLFRANRGHLTTRQLFRPIAGNTSFQFSVDWENLTPVNLQQVTNATYRNLFENVLNDVKIIEAQFNLSETDIESFDRLKPIYVRQYGAYFKVNKIKNFIAGKLTSVELIKLK